MRVRGWVQVVLSSWVVLGLVVCSVLNAYAQTEAATIRGSVSDSSGAVISNAAVRLIDVDRGTRKEVQTGSSGFYSFASVAPGRYRMEVEKSGFRLIHLTGITANVQDNLEENFKLDVGAVSESITVEANGVTVNTADATVSTVVDRQFAENLPMNGRSFQTLIQLTPGVVVVPARVGDAGQFSINGQRPSSNYWMVDGVSANIGVGAVFDAGNGIGGAIGSFSVMGGTNSLVSVDAMQEFRIQTSTYAPEFGRTPGGQVSILTRSGTNQFHGTVFDYLRNDVLDANDWFADQAGLRKPEERQNDFGGTFGGPLVRDRTFFFFSYEGLRLRLPQVAETTVPSISSRQNALPGIQPFFNAFPVPAANAPDVNGMSPFNASYSNRATLDAYSLRVDHRLGNAFAIFGRYNHSPSELVTRAFSFGPLSNIAPERIMTQTATLGLTWTNSPAVTNEFRFNYSRTDGSSSSEIDSFGGAVPPSSLPFPDSFSSQNGRLFFDILSLTNSNLFIGKNIQNLLRQLNVIDTLSSQKGSHSLKFGFDFRRLSPTISPQLYDQIVLFGDVASAESGNLLFSRVDSNVATTLLERNLGVFAQDTWRVTPAFTMTYGLRWDVDFAPSSTSGPNIPAVTNLRELPNLSLAPTGTPPFETTYGNVAPRLGAAYQLTRNQNWGTVLRGGFGAFFDLATSEVGNLVLTGFPFTARALNFGGTFPLSSAAATPPPITPAGLSSSTLSAYNPHIQLPFTLQWNVALEEALGGEQTLSASYIGSAGRRLLQTELISNPNPQIGQLQLVGNTARSEYNALQLQFQRRLSHGMQALASYTWAHSIDDGSAGSVVNPSNGFFPSSTNRGPSDFDIRNAFSVGITYDIPAPKSNNSINAVLRGWSVQNVIQLRTAPPVDVVDGLFGATLQGFGINVRPDVDPAIPLYIYGSQFPGGKAFNNTVGAVAGGCSDGSQSIGPFCPPPTDANGNPLRQGTLPRNALQGFGANQWDFGVHREFPIRELLTLQFRAELFNILNHPNFAQPIGDISNPKFGQSAQMLGQSLGGNVGGGGFAALYQIGGPRSVQLALKLSF